MAHPVLDQQPGHPTIRCQPLASRSVGGITRCPPLVVVCDGRADGANRFLLVSCVWHGGNLRTLTLPNLVSPANSRTTNAREHRGRRGEVAAVRPRLSAL